MKRPFDISSRSSAVTAVSSGERPKAQAIAVPSLNPSRSPIAAPASASTPEWLWNSGAQADSKPARSAAAPARRSRAGSAARAAGRGRRSRRRRRSTAAIASLEVVEEAHLCDLPPGETPRAGELSRGRDPACPPSRVPGPAAHLPITDRPRIENLGRLLVEVLDQPAHLRQEGVASLDRPRLGPAGRRPQDDVRRRPARRSPRCHRWPRPCPSGASGRSCRMTRSSRLTVAAYSTGAVLFRPCASESRSPT